MRNNNGGLNHLDQAVIGELARIAKQDFTVTNAKRATDYILSNAHPRSLEKYFDFYYHRVIGYKRSKEIEE